MVESAYLYVILNVKHKRKKHIYRGFNLILGKIQVVGQDEPIKTWKKHMCRETRAETTVTKAWSWILIGRENEVRYASQSGSEATNKWRLSIDSSNPLFNFEY